MKMDIYQNAERYADPTAGKAIWSAEGKKMAQFTDGDIIWTNDVGREVLILRDHGNYATIVTVFENEQYSDNYSFRTEKGVRHICCGKPNFLKYSGKETRVCTIESRTLSNIKAKIIDALGGGAARPAEKPAAAQPESAAAQMKSLREKLIRTEAQRDVYKNLFEEERKHE